MKEFGIHRDGAGSSRGLLSRFLGFGIYRYGACGADFGVKRLWDHSRFALSRSLWDEGFQDHSRVVLSGSLWG